ncbi:2-polyprenyl-6-methoxyphenol hydroxylase-like FAD-dependent oxidoreductase [Nocardia transvalensis]|uniref:2-polyprenyl-6-methoxyphenol hydroxylase-like FAD-dependent oxidoreductase n=1 Tax=Nocardia transvalensis TaxID=37333 RepID=A0A7W9PEA0_9NOCA|nr:FAD-dependent monooxygenase [Nocardia transvalensis]MBB5914502.1 2-polyprenyl-6-methoxyphenol hydroxylase-like FAD-dependent oxidoreductase [Nocardia transvalensis]
MSHVPVVIAGGGTVGLAAAVFLGQHGVRSLVVERRERPSIHPRALGISPRTLEFFREAGLREDLARVAVRSAQPWRAEARTVAEIDRGTARQPKPPAGLDFSPESPSGHYPQNRLDSALLPAARERGATVEFGVEVTEVAQDRDSVAVTLSDGRVVHADYLIGADGVNSTVRRKLDITTTGPGEIGPTNMNILFDADLVAHFGSMPVMTQIDHPDAPGVLLAVGEQRWALHVQLPPGETTMPDRHCADVMRTAIGADVPARLVSAIPWRATVRMADEFRSGRSFLVGDAARSVSPLGAFGLNTGVADAHNLAWKLAAVLRGEAGDGLLDTYHTERHAIAELVTRQALLRLDNPRLHWDSDAVAERAAAGVWNAPMVTMGYRYASAAVIDPVLALPSTEDVAAALDGAPGSRMPHLWIAPGVSTLDLNDSRFAVLAGPRGEDWCEAARKTAAAMEFDLRAACLNDAAAAAVHIGDRGAILVRPDGFIAWRTDAAADTGVLTEVVDTLLSRNDSHGRG